MNRTKKDISGECHWHLWAPQKQVELEVQSVNECFNAIHAAWYNHQSMWTG